MSLTAHTWLQRITSLAFPDKKIRVINVCGGHERTITQTGIRTILKDQVVLIPGPGCPVCVCPEEDIFAAIHIALNNPVTVVAFGDMLRVPVNLPPTMPRSLEQAKAAGGDILPIASPMEAVQLAKKRPDRQIVFFAAGFETTMAPVAAMIQQDLPDNLSLLISGRLTWPAVKLLLSSEHLNFDALIAPGHVATVAGPEEWAFVAQHHNLPVAVSGFTPDQLLAGLFSVLKQVVEGQAFLDNCYGGVVRPGGNPGAIKLLQDTLDIVDAPWRGLGIIPNSSYQLKSAWQDHDAQRRFPIPDQEKNRLRARQMPPGCDCAAVILGRIPPTHCRLYGEACSPRHPVGPCMVSEEGACRIWWTHRVS
ncbi:MAG: hydrogenase formation protein HypD [Magnetococcales bacterium]|nr:hydrogenase formation protein HypD [Magnetococcales bacterium]